MLNLIDKLAGWWLDRRLSRSIRYNPNLLKAEFTRAQLDETGFHLVASFPSVFLLIDEAAGVLKAGKAEDYIQFDMMPRIDRCLPPVRVTVQWAKSSKGDRNVST